MRKCRYLGGLAGRGQGTGAAGRGGLGMGGRLLGESARGATRCGRFVLDVWVTLVVQDNGSYTCTTFFPSPVLFLYFFSFFLGERKEGRKNDSSPRSRILQSVSFFPILSTRPCFSVFMLYWYT